MAPKTQNFDDDEEFQAFAKQMDDAEEGLNDEVEVSSAPVEGSESEDANAEEPASHGRGESAGEGDQVDGKSEPQHAKAPDGADSAEEVDYGTDVPGVWDAEGNLRDPNGNIMARKGREAKMFVERHDLRIEKQKLNARVAALQNENGQLRQEVQRGPAQIAQRYQLQPDEMENAASIYATFKTDPVRAAQHILAHAVQRGASLEQIVGQQGLAQINTQAIINLLDQRLGQQQASQPSREALIEAQARQDLQNFVDRHQYATVHGEQIVGLVRAAQQQGLVMSPEEAYHRLEVYAARHGLDFRFPLAPQLRARQQASIPRVETSANEQVNIDRPMLGDGTLPLPARVNTQVADEHTSYNDLLRLALAEVNAQEQRNRG